MDKYTCVKFSSFASTKNKQFTLTIHEDDTIRDVYEKVKVKYPGSNIYMWCKSNVIDKERCVNTFIQDCFSLQTFISYDHFENCVYNTFEIKLDMKNEISALDSDMAYSILSKKVINFKNKSLLASYFQTDSKLNLNYPINPLLTNDDNDYFNEYDTLLQFSKVIGTFDIQDKTIYFIDESFKEDLPDLYFIKDSNVDEEYTKNKELRVSQVYSSIRANNYNDNSETLETMRISQAAFRLNESARLENNKLDLSKIFASFSPDDIFPFIKHVSLNGNTYKILKKNSIDEEHLQKWTTTKNISREYIIVKVYLNNFKKYCTVILYSSSIIDVYCTFSISNSPTKTTFANIFPIINETISYLYNESSILSNNIWDTSFKDSYVTKYVSMNNIIVPTKTYDVHKIKNVVENTLEHFFNVKPIIADNKVQFVYKRCDDFTLEEHISKFIKSQNKKNIVKKISEYYSINKQLSEYYLNNNSNTNVYMRFWNRKNITLSIVTNVRGYFVLLEGIENSTQEMDLIALVRYIINSKKTTSSDKKVENIVEDVINNDVDDDDDDDDINGIPDGEIDVDFYNEFVLLDNNINQEPVDNDEQQVKVGKKKEGKDQGILNSLIAADPGLFSVGSYAKSCQMTMQKQPRQPIVVTNKELEDINKTNNGAIKNALSNFGSTPDKAKKNNYICPQVWCPKSRTALSASDFEKAGNKCPNADDAPIVYYKSEYFRSGNIFTKLMALKDKKTSTISHAPCCYASMKVKKGEKEEVVSGDAETLKKYIVKETTVPLDKNRFGLLPIELSVLFGNTPKNCSTGHMTTSTNAVLRYGVNTSSQSFIDCILYVLKLDLNYEQFSKLIIENVDMSLYLKLSNGTICRTFIDENGKYDIHNVDEYKEFASWFLDQKIYIHNFNLKKVSNKIYGTSSFTGDQHILREFTLYNSYKDFIKYMTDVNIIKSHDVLFHILNENNTWLNPFNIHFILFEANEKGDVALYCDPYQNQDPNSVQEKAFIIKQGIYYEPIIKANLAGSNVSILKYFNNNDKADLNIKKILKYYTSQCSSKLHFQNENALLLIKTNLEEISTFVLDYNLRCIGFKLDSKLYVPFLKPAYITSILADKKKYKQTYEFIDSIYASIIKTPIDKADATTFFNKNNKLIKDYFVFENINEDYMITKSNIIIPLKTFKDDEKLEAIYSDLHIFNNWKIKDDRIRLIDEMRYIDNMKGAVFNEILHIIHKDPKLKEIIYDMRKDNLLTTLQKKNLIYTKLKPNIAKVFVIDPSNKNISFENYTNTCKAFKTTSTCSTPCTFLINNTSGQSCKLKLPANKFDIVIANSIDKLLDFNTSLNISNVKKHNNNDKEYIIFNDTDIENGFIARIMSLSLITNVQNVQKINHEKFNTIIDVETDKIENSSITEFVDVKKFKNIHASYTNYFKRFNRCTFDGYNNMTVYKMFSHLHNKINNKKKSPEELRDQATKMVLKEYKTDIRIKKWFELYHAKDVTNMDDPKFYSVFKESFPSVVHVIMLSRLLKVNIIIFSRIKSNYNQIIRCVDPIQKNENVGRPYLFLNQSNYKDMYDKFEIICKNLGMDNLQFLFYNLKDIISSEEVIEDILRKCVLEN